MICYAVFTPIPDKSKYRHIVLNVDGFMVQHDGCVLDSLCMCSIWAVYVPSNYDVSCVYARGHWCGVWIQNTNCKIRPDRFDIEPLILLIDLLYADTSPAITISYSSCTADPTYNANAHVWFGGANIRNC